MKIEEWTVVTPEEFYTDIVKFTNEVFGHNQDAVITKEFDKCWKDDMLWIITRWKTSDDTTPVRFGHMETWTDKRHRIVKYAIRTASGTQRKMCFEEYKDDFQWENTHWNQR